MTITQPYFMENEDWYIINEPMGTGYTLTDKTPPEAVKSYRWFMKVTEFGGMLGPVLMEDMERDDERNT